MRNSRSPWFVASVGLVIAVSACSGGAKNASSSGSTTSTTVAAHPGTTSPHGPATTVPDRTLSTASPTITYTGKSFTPGTLKVKRGTVIRVVDNAASDVQIVSDSGSSFGTGTMVHHETDMALAPSVPGTYHYHAANHPSTTGTLVVT